jgi:cell division septal protein FtsQ|tara:strand:- start:610 stop:795 length:186 start_codon:yes stop_codon:yes gene_type:complete
MQFEKNTRVGKKSVIIKLLIKIILVFLVLLIAVILIDRIDFPSPIKKIEKVIPNENFKIVK